MTDAEILAELADIREQGDDLVAAIQQLMLSIGGSAATKLQFNTQPDGGVVSTAFTTQPVVRALKADNSVDTSYTGNITIAKLSGSGSLSGTATVAAVAGVATFSGLSLGAAGHYVLEATAAGLTSAQSGYMTVMPAAVAARVPLTFGANTTDKGDCGSSASLDNLTSGTMTLVARLKRTSTGTNQFILSKYNAAGWYIQADDSIVTGGIAASVKRATTDAFRATSGANVIAVDSWYDLAMTWDSSDNPTIRIYIAAVGSALAESSSYDASSANGSGSVSSDASSNCWIGNLELTGVNPFKGAIEWAAVFSEKLTLQEMTQVQIGFDRADATTITNAGTCVLLHRLNATGTLTDLSGNSNDCVITGATTTTGETVHAPSVFAYSPDSTDQTTHWQSSGHSEAIFSTAATSVSVGYYRLLSDYTSQNAIAVYEDGTYKGQIAASATGFGYGTLALSSGTKTVRLVNSVHSRVGSVGTGTDGIGTQLISARFNNTATASIPATPTPTNTYLFIHDSIIDGFVANPVGRYGPIGQMRNYFASETPGSQVHSLGFGGQSLYKIASDGTARTAAAAAVAKHNPTKIIISLGINDYSGNLWTHTDYGTAYAALFTAINGSLPNATIYAVTPPVLATGEGANGLGSTLANYRTAVSTAASGKSYVTVVDGTTIFDGTNLGDTVHPNNTGCDEVYSGLSVALGFDAPPTGNGLLTSLKAYWKLDEASGNRSDSFGSITLTDTNTVGSTTGVISNAADFEADNTEYLTVSDTADLRFNTGSCSFSLWFRAETLATYPVLFVKRDNAGPFNAYALYYNTDTNKLIWEVQSGSGGTTTTLDCGSISTGVTYHIVCWHDADGDVIGASVNNGTPVTAAHSAGIGSSNGNFSIGAAPAQSIYWDGWIDEFGAWSVVLTSDQRSALYNSGSGLAYGDFT